MHVPLVTMGFDVSRLGVPVTMPYRPLGRDETVVALRTITISLESSSNAVEVSFYGTDPRGLPVSGPVDVARISDPGVREFITERSEHLRRGQP